MSTLSSRLASVLFCAIVFCPCIAHAQSPSAGDILRKVAERYRNVSSFSVVAEKKVELDTDTMQERYRHIDPSEARGGSHEEHEIQVTMMASSASKAKLLLKNNKKKIVVVSDGKVIWTMIPAQHAYTQLPARSAEQQDSVYILQLGSSDISGAGLLKEYEALVVGRFRSITNYESSATLKHSKTLKVGKDKKECYVLLIQPEEGGKQKLWIDKTDFTVWKSADTTTSAWDYNGDSVDTTVTLTTKQLTLNPSLDESNFVFTPPEKAKKVRLLRLSGNNPF